MCVGMTAQEIGWRYTPWEWNWGTTTRIQFTGVCSMTHWRLHAYVLELSRSIKLELINGRQFQFKIPIQTPTGQYLLRMDLIWARNGSAEGVGIYPQTYPSCAQIRIESNTSGRPPNGFRIPEDLSPKSPGNSTLSRVFSNTHFVVPCWCPALQACVYPKRWQMGKQWTKIICIQVDHYGMGKTW